MSVDPEGIRLLRESSLRAWADSPTRFREDANLEEDFSRGHYRDRVVVELAQNAADAAVRGRAGGRLLLRLTADEEGDLLVAADTGAPLTSEGLQALVALRASAKRSPAGDGPPWQGADPRPRRGAGMAEVADPGPGAGTVGAFGVGFSAVRSVADDVVLVSRSADGVTGVRFGLAPAREAVTAQAVPGSPLARELALREDRLPVLRLPFPAPEGSTIPDGYDTAVVLRLRDDDAREAVSAQLDALDDWLLLSLPALGEVVVEQPGRPGRRLADLADRWRVRSAEGELDTAALTSLPLEQRARPVWRVAWALPRDAGPWPSAGRLLAPTPTDDPCSLPGLLVASLPLDATRRRVVQGAAAEVVLHAAGRVYAELAREVALAAPDEVLSLVPSGLPAGWADGVLHGAALEALRGGGLLAPVGAGERAGGSAPVLLRPEHTLTLTGGEGQDRRLLEVLGGVVDGVVQVPPHLRSQARAVGVAFVGLGELVHALPAAEGAPAWWEELCTALLPHVQGAEGARLREELGMLPVPLAGGGIARGARGLVLPGRSADGLGPLRAHGLRVVDPRAVHPLLEALGAIRPEGWGLVEHPSVRAAVAELAAALDRGDDVDDGLVSAVIALVEEAGADSGDRPDEPPFWLGDLPLPVQGGGWERARELVLPGSWAEEVVDALDPVDDGAVDRWGGVVLAALGVREDLTVLTVHDVVAGEDDWHEGGPLGSPAETLDRWPEYLAYLAPLVGGTGAYLGEVRAVADLDAVAEDSWDRVLERISADPSARAALVTTVRGAPSYTAWWLRGHLGAPFADGSGAAGRGPLALPSPPPEVRRWLGAAAAGDRPVDDAVRRAVGAVRDLAELDARGWEIYLEDLPETGTAVEVSEAVPLWRSLTVAARAGLRLEVPPERLPALRPSGDGVPTAELRPVEEIAIAAEPMWAQCRPVLPAPAGDRAALARMLGLDAQGADADGDVGLGPDSGIGIGDIGLGPDRGSPAVTPPAVVALLPQAPVTWVEHEALAVLGSAVDWWVDPSGRVHACTTAGLARGLAQAAGRWELRHAVEAVLADPAAAPALSAESAWDPVADRAGDAGPASDPGRGWDDGRR